MCVALHSLPLSTGCRVSSQNTRGSQCTCVPFSNQKVVTKHFKYVRTYHSTLVPMVLPIVEYRYVHVYVPWCHGRTSTYTVYDGIFEKAPLLLLPMVHYYHNTTTTTLVLPWYHGIPHRHWHGNTKWVHTGTRCTHKGTGTGVPYHGTRVL